MKNAFVNREAPADGFQNLPELEQSLSKQVKMALVYITGYLARKNPAVDDTVEPVLKTTSIKRPPLHNDHSQVRPSNIW